MKVTIKGTKIILSETPRQDVAGAFLIFFKRKLNKSDIKTLDKNRQRKNMGLSEVKEIVEEKLFDVHKGQKEYDLPKGVAKKDIEALYLRVL